MPFRLKAVPHPFSGPAHPPGLSGCLTLPTRPGRRAPSSSGNIPHTENKGIRDRNDHRRGSLLFPPLKARRELLMRGGDHGRQSSCSNALSVSGVSYACEGHSSDDTATRRTAPETLDDPDGSRCVRSLVSLFSALKQTFSNRNSCLWL